MPADVNVRVATDSPITRSGTQTISTVPLGVGDDVFLFNQPDGSKNGIWRVQTGAWIRHPSYDASVEFVLGFTVFVREGTPYGGWNFQFKNSDVPTLETTMLNFRATSRDNVEEAGGSLELVDGAYRLKQRAGVQGTHTSPTITLDQYGMPVQLTAGVVSRVFYIDGLELAYVTGTSLSLRAGSAWVEGLGYALEATADIAKSGLSLLANTWYYAYFFSNAGAPDFELSTTAPAEPYSAFARSKAGDTTRRLVGELKTDAGGAIQRVRVEGRGSNPLVRYMKDHTLAPFRILSTGTATTLTTVSCIPVVPVTAITAWIRVLNTTDRLARISNPNVTENFISVFANQDVHALVPLSTTQELQYSLSAAPTSGGLNLDVLGYYQRR